MVLPAVRALTAMTANTANLEWGVDDSRRPIFGSDRLAKPRARWAPRLGSGMANAPRLQGPGANIQRSDNRTLHKESCALRPDGRPGRSHTRRSQPHRQIFRPATPTRSLHDYASGAWKNHPSELRKGIENYRSTRSRANVTSVTWHLGKDYRSRFGPVRRPRT
jgi:hypothetical protein